MPSADQTAGWKTYNNAQYNFQLNYPSEWVLSENLAMGSIEIKGYLGTSTETSLSSFQIRIRDLSGTTQLTNLQNNINSKVTNLGGMVVTHIAVGGVPAIRYLHTDPSATVREDDVQFLKGNIGFDINEKYDLTESSASAEQSIQLLDKILSSFKFTK